MDSRLTFRVDGRLLSEEEARELFRNGHVEPRDLDPRQRQVLSLIRAHACSGRLLDVGCYSGAFLQALRSVCPELQAVGVDSFPDHVELARLLYPERAESFLCRSAYELGFPNESFEVVTFLAVIEHLDRPVDAVREINRVLRTGGLLIVSTPNGVSCHNLVSTLWAGYRNPLARRRGRRATLRSRVYFADVAWNRHIHEFVPDCLQTLLEVNGFETIDHRFVGATGWRGVRDCLFPGLAAEQVFLARKVASPAVPLV